MRNNLVKLLLAVMLVLTLALAACGKDSDNEGQGNNNDPNNTEEPGDNNNNDNGNDNNEEPEEPLTKKDEILSRFNQESENQGDPIEGGHLNYGLVSSSPFAGVFNYNFYNGAPDAEVLAWFDEGMLGMDGDFLYDQTGIATFEHDEDGKVFTFKIKEGVEYHDGTELTVHDWVFAHEVIAHPNYTGVRYDATLRNVEGIDAFHDGDADEISGLKVIDNYTLEMTFKEATPSLLAGGIWTYVLPRHIFEDVDPGEIEEHPMVRETPVGLGPYKVDVIVPGESVTYTRYDNYWRGKPALETVTLKVIASANAGKALESGELDMLSDFPASQFPEYKDLENVEFLAHIDNYYSYIGFKLGHWDHDEKRVKMDPDKKMSDPELRRAMAHAFDGDIVGEKFYNDLHWAANSLIDPGHRLYHDPTWEGFEYDPELAKKILDDAGYEYDGEWRTTPDGEELVINYAAMDSAPISEAMANYYVQSWQDIGLNVQLLDGRLHEFNDFYDRVGQSGEDDPEIDVYAGAWGTGSNVDPSGLYGPEAMFNFSRFESEESDRLIKEGLSTESFDLEYRKDVYAQWHELMKKEVPVIPVTFAVELTPLNKRVTNVNVDPDVKSYRYEIGVTEEDPIK